MDLESFRAFYDSHARAVQIYVQSMTGDSAIAADITQEAFLRLLTAKGAGELAEAHRRNYLFRIATNLVHDHRRSAARLAPGPVPDIPAEGRFDLAIRDLVRKALARLKTRERELLWLAVVEESSHGDIAARTGYRVSSIAPLLYQARKNFRAAVANLLQHKGPVT